MKSLYIMFLLSIVGLSSCVSAGKYKDLEASFNRQVEVNDSLDIEIKSHLNQIANLKKQIDGLNNEIKNIETNYTQLKANSSDEIQTLINKLEQLQADLVIRQNKINEIEAKLKARDESVNALRATLQRALLGFTDSGLTISIKDGRVYVSLSNQLLFRSGRTDIDPKGQEAIRELSYVLNSNPGINILVEGHTDDVKVTTQQRFKDNWDLSVLRATEVARFLTEQCEVDPKRVTASGRGEFFPILTGDSPEERAVNRRTEIILTPHLDKLFEFIE